MTRAEAARTYLAAVRAYRLGELSETDFQQAHDYYRSLPS